MDIFSSLLSVHMGWCLLNSAAVSRYRGLQSAFRRVAHQRPRRRRRRRVYFGPFRNNPENNGVDQIVTRPVGVDRLQ